MPRNQGIKKSLWVSFSLSTFSLIVNDQDAEDDHHKADEYHNNAD